MVRGQRGALGLSLVMVVVVMVLARMHVHVLVVVVLVFLLLLLLLLHLVGLRQRVARVVLDHKRQRTRTRGARATTWRGGG